MEKNNGAESGASLHVMKFLFLLLVTAPSFYVLEVLSFSTSFFSPLTFLFHKSVVASPFLYGVITATALSFVTSHRLKIILKAYAVLGTIVLLATGATFYQSGLVETHTFPGHPPVEIRNEEILDPCYTAYLKRGFYRSTICYLDDPPSQTAVEKWLPENGERVVGNDRTIPSSQTLYEVHWSKNGKRIAFSSKGWYLVAFDLEENYRVEPEPGRNVIATFLKAEAM